MRRVAVVLSIALALFVSAMFAGSVLSRASEKQKPVNSSLTSVSSNFNQGRSNNWNAHHTRTWPALFKTFI